VPENLGRNEVFHDRGDYQGQARADHHHAPGDHSPLKAGYIFADCFPSDSSCSSAADHTYFNSHGTFVNGKIPISSLEVVAMPQLRNDLLTMEISELVTMSLQESDAR